MATRFTILDWGKQTGDAATIGVTQKLAGGNAVLEVLPFQTTGLVHPYIVESALPTVAFRGLNEAFSESVALILPQAEILKPLGGKNKTDEVLASTNPRLRAQQDLMYVKAQGRQYAFNFFSGDSGAQPREWDGLARRLSGAQVISAGATDNGMDLATAAVVDKFDEMLDQLSGGDPENTKIFMSNLQKRKLTKYSRDNSLHQMQWPLDAAGRRVTTWNDYEIRSTDMDDDASQTPLISETEWDSGNNNQTTTSIYCVRFSADGDYVSGLQTADGIVIADRGQGTENPEYVYTYVRWLCGMLTPTPRAAARLQHLQTT